MDVLVEGQVVVELKATDGVTPVHEATLITYMKLSQKRVGLIINFHNKMLVDGITRRVL
jgi:GxxExxY protein